MDGHERNIMPFLFFWIIMISCGSLLLSGFPFSLQQSRGQIAQIELVTLNSSGTETAKLLPESDWEPFLDQLSALKCSRPIVGTGNTSLGAPTIRVSYKNGSYEIIGAYVNMYCTGRGTSYGNETFPPEAFAALIAQYIE